MKEMCLELGHWMSRVETILIARGVLDEDGRISADVSSPFPEEIQNALDGFIENPIELIGLLKISREAQEGRRLSPAVLSAAHLMAREVLQALQSADNVRDNGPSTQH